MKTFIFQVIPMARAQDTCIHGFIATQCGAICKKGPGEIDEITFVPFPDAFHYFSSLMYISCGAGFRHR